MSDAIYVPEYPTRPAVPGVAARSLEATPRRRPWRGAALVLSLLVIAMIGGTLVSQTSALSPEVAARTATSLWLGR